MLSIEPVERLSRTEDLLALFEEQVRQMRSDESGAPRDEYTHGQ